MNGKADAPTRDQLIAAFGKFVAQRPGFDPRMYGDPASYRADLRTVARQRRDAEALLSWVAWHDSLTAEMLLHALDGAFSGRLAWNAARGLLDYTTGQYWCTEYRAAACAVLSSAIWAWLRDSCGYKTGDAIRAAALREFGRGIAARWFR